MLPASATQHGAPSALAALSPTLPQVVDGGTEYSWQNDRRVPCVNIWVCMLVIIDSGVRKEDVGEAMDKVAWPTLTNATGQCEVCLPEQNGVSCGPVNYCDGLLGWPQSKLWIRMIYTFLWWCLMTSIVMEVGCR